MKERERGEKISMILHFYFYIYELRYECASNFTDRMKFDPKGEQHAQRFIRWKQ